MQCLKLRKFMISLPRYARRYSYQMCKDRIFCSVINLRLALIHLFNHERLGYIKENISIIYINNSNNMSFT